MFRIFAALSAASAYDRVKRILTSTFSPARTTVDGSLQTGAHGVLTLATDFQALEAETQSPDHWVSRARPTFLYVIYAMILWALPMGLVAAISPRMSHAITKGMTDYLSALPAELYTLFGTGYLGYATLRQWGKTRGTDR